MRSLVILSAASLILPAVPAHAENEPEPVRLETRTEWVLDYANERCSLHRGFGEGENSVNLRIDWFGPGDDHRIMLVGSLIPKARGARSELAFRLTPDAELRPGDAINGTFLDLPAVSFNSTFLPYDPEVVWDRMSVAEQMQFSSVPRPPQPEFEKEVRSLEVRFSNGSAIQLTLGSMAKPLEALRTCMDNLQSVWGLDPAVQRSLSRKAVPKPSTVRRVQRHYPIEMLREGMNAFVPVRVMVDAEGAVSDCVVQSEGIDQAFTDTVCDGLARGYEPALDASGAPVPSVYATSVIYMVR